MPLVWIVKKNDCFWQFHGNWKKQSIVICLLEYFFNYFLWDIYICNYYLLIMPAVWGTSYLLSVYCWAWVLSLYQRNFPPHSSCCLCWDSVRFCEELAMHSNPYLWFPVWLTDHPVHHRKPSVKDTVMTPGLVPVPGARQWVSMRKLQFKLRKIVKTWDCWLVEMNANNKAVYKNVL